MIRIAHLSDIHFGGENVAAVAGAAQLLQGGEFDLTIVSGDLTQFGAARYLRGAAWVVPVVVRGTDALFGRDERFRPQPVQVAFGEAFDPGAVMGDAKTAALEEARRRVLGVRVG